MAGIPGLARRIRLSTLIGGGERWILLGTMPLGEHAFLAAMLAFVGFQVAVVGYMAYRVHRASQRIETIGAATFLEVRRVLGQSR
jgi:hypothetical protein